MATSTIEKSIKLGKRSQQVLARALSGKASASFKGVKSFAATRESLQRGQDILARKSSR